MIIYANLDSNLSVSFWGEDFQKINMHYNGKNNPAPVGASLTEEVLANLWRVTRWSLMLIYSQICPLVSEKKIFKVFAFCLKPFLLPWQPEFCMESKSLDNFERTSPKEHFSKVWLQSALWLKRRCLRKLLTTDTHTHSGQHVITKVHHEHFVFRWARNSSW